MTITYIVLLVLLIIASIQDIRQKKISLILLGVSFIITIISLCLQREISIMNHIWGSIIGMFLCSVSILTRGAIGWGDGLMFTVLGVGLGFFITINILFLTLFLAALYSIWLLLIKKVNRKKTIPLIPFMLMGFVGVMIQYGI